MNPQDEKRVERIKSKILLYSKKKLEYIRANDLDRAYICSRMIESLYNKERDILEGIERIMDRRKEELLVERNRLESSIHGASFIEKMELKKELYKIDNELQEDNLREYARNKKKESKVKKRGTV